MRDEEVDLGITGGELLDASIEVLHQSDDRLSVVCPEGHLLVEARTT
jgi:hypothetical protein